MSTNLPADIQPAFAGPWPWEPLLVRAELESYVREASLPEVASLPTRCEPWTVAELTAHLAATFHRFTEMLRWARQGRFDPPFQPSQLDEENMRAVEEFSADPVAKLCTEGQRWLSLATSPDEPLAHQRGVIPASLQMLWGLLELIVHHDDLAGARGGAYGPPPAAVAAVVPALTVLGAGTPPNDVDRWRWVLQATGR